MVSGSGGGSSVVVTVTTPASESNSRIRRRSACPSMASESAFLTETSSNAKPKYRADDSKRAMWRSSSTRPVSGSNNIVSIRSKRFTGSVRHFIFNRHSSYSLDPLESKTTPEPIPISPAASRKTTAVRIATLKSARPSGEMWPMAPQYTPRGSASSARVSSIARILGAPVTDPGGKMPCSSSVMPMPSFSVARTPDVI